MPDPTPDRPGPGQESVWDYPRPAVAELIEAHIVVVLGGETIAEARQAGRTIETSHPPSSYLPPSHPHWRRRRDRASANGRGMRATST